MNYKLIHILFWTTIGVTLPVAAHAHLVDARFGDFYAGLIHPLTALEHVFPFVAMGLLAGQQGARGARYVLVCFSLALIAGVTAGFFVNSPVVVYINGFSFIVIGGLVALSKGLPGWLLVVTAGVFGLTHGIANGAVLGPDTLAFNFVSGVVSAGIIIVSLGAGVVLSLGRPWTKIAVRVAGSWIAAIGIMTMALM